MEQINLFFAQIFDPHGVTLLRFAHVYKALKMETWTWRSLSSMD